MWASGTKQPKQLEPWLEVVTRIIAGTMHQFPSQGATPAAEAGLGIEPSCYWYVWRADDLYSFVVFLWIESGAPSFQPEDGAVCLFDTGGLWDGRVRTIQILSGEQRRELCAQYATPVDTWRATFRAYVTENYEDAADYVRGIPPRVGVIQIERVADNKAPAWTLEARVSKTRFAGQVAVSRIYWQEQDRSRFERFLETDAVDEESALQIQQMVTDYSVICPTDRAAGSLANQFLVGEVGSSL